MHPRDRHLFASIRREFTDAAGNPLRAASKSGEHISAGESERRARVETVDTSISDEPQHGVRKCRVPREPKPLPEHVELAKDVYFSFVQSVGGYTELADIEECDESAVRQRLIAPNKQPPMSVLFARRLPGRLKRKIAMLLLSEADAEEAGQRVA